MGVKLRLAVPAAVLLAAAGVGAAYATTMSTGGATVKTEHSSSLGMLISSSTGFTLYHYTDDKKGSIECTGACAKLWPPLTIKAGTKPTAGAGVTAAKLSTIKRPDGKTQVTYNGLTLYRYSGDAKPGSVKGQGIQGSWFAVSAKGTLAKGAASSGGGYVPPPTMPATTYDNGGYGGGGGY